MSAEALTSTSIGMEFWLKGGIPSEISYSQDVNATSLVTETSLHAFVMQYTQELATVGRRLQKALDEIQNLRDELSRRPLVSTVNLYDLGTDMLRIKLPISVVLHETEEESTARWPETRAYGIGATISEAIFDLKQNIAALFSDLISRPTDSLGEIAVDTLRILRMHLGAAQ